MESQIDSMIDTINDLEAENAALKATVLAQQTTKNQSMPLDISNDEFDIGN